MSEDRAQKKTKSKKGKRSAQPAHEDQGLLSFSVRASLTSKRAHSSSPAALEELPLFSAPPAQLPPPELPPPPQASAPQLALEGPEPSPAHDARHDVHADADDDALEVEWEEVEAQPTETQPTEAQPTEAQPTEAQPTEAQPTEAQPTEAQPIEAQPNNTTQEEGEQERAEHQALVLAAERVERLFEEAQRYADAARSPQTKRAYQSDWRDFSAWCVEHHMHPLPAPPEAIALYLTDRAETLKISTLRRRLTALRQLHKIKGYNLDTKHAAIQSVWGGIRREKGSLEVGKDPLRVDLLRLMMLTRPRDLKGLRDRALLLLGFTGAFRRSELVALNRGDLEFVPQGLKVTVRRSKTDQEGHGMTKSILPGQHEETCCLKALQVWLQASQIQSGPIFRPINRHGQLRARRLTSHAVAVLLKDAISDALRAQGLPEAQIEERVAQFSGHSLRAGYVTSAAAEGAEEHTIMRQTGHKRVDTLRRYIREGDLFRHNPLKRMDL